MTLARGGHRSPDGCRGRIGSTTLVPGKITKVSRCSDRGDTAAVERRRARRNGDSLTVDHWGLVGPARHRGEHRRLSHPTAVRDRVIVVAVAAGAITSSGSALVTQHEDNSGEHIDLIAHQSTISPSVPDAPPTASDQPQAPAPLPGVPEPITPRDDAAVEKATSMVTSLMTGTAIDTQRQIIEETARRPQAAMPTSGSLTSGFGQRWGALHGGADIANAIGTPILAASDGMVIDAGPAQGFGNWVRIMSDEGTMTVYGHMEEVLVSTGQRVQAGQTIALMGNRGFSTGPHLHFEVWTNQGRDRADPLEWLRQKGVDPDSSTSLSVQS